MSENKLYLHVQFVGDKKQHKNSKIVMTCVKMQKIALINEMSTIESNRKCPALKEGIG